MDADALSGEGSLGEIAVVGLAVGLQTEVARRREQPLDVEVADEVGVGNGCVAIAEGAVDEEAVVEQASAEHAFDVDLVPALVTRRQVSAEVPVAIADGVGEEVVELAGEGRGEQALYGSVGLTLVGGESVGIEAPDAEEVDDLHVTFLVGRDE